MTWKQNNNMNRMLGLLMCAMAVVLLNSNCNNNSNTIFAVAFQMPNPAVFKSTASAATSRIVPNTASRSTSSTSTSLFVFERMSEDCIAAIVTAQKQTAQNQLPQVDTPAMLAGCIDQAGSESKALERTFKQYRITWRGIEKTLKEVYSESADDKNAGWLSGFRAAKTDEDRPFSNELKKRLVEAGKLADQMGSTTVGTQHVFLALLEYKEPATGTPTAVDAKSDDNDAWYVLKRMKVLDESVTPLDICQSFLGHLQTLADEDNGKELVTGIDSDGKMPTLADCGTDLTQQAQDGLLDPVYGRDYEIRSCVRTLIRRRKNNVCLIGEPGVGKTAIAEGVAQILVDETKCPTPLKGHRLVSLELSALVAGTKYRGEFEERLQNIIKEVTDEKAPPTILFLDEIHNLVGAGSAEGGMDAANLLKPALARGALQVIGATTIEEYRKYIEKDAALERRLQPVMVKEPSILQTIDILKAVQPNYERHHNVRYTPAALEAAASLSERYISDRFLPDKALDLLDESGAIAQLEYLDGLLDGTAAPEDSMDENNIPIVTEETVASVISEWSGIPMGKLESNEMDRLLQLEAEMGTRVKGQGRAIRGVARAIRRARSGLRDPKRPVASFLFCGPTGTGKTELCKTLAEQYYGSEKDMIRIDMSEYMEKHAVSRLTGPPPGYIGYESGGQLTEAVRRAPHSVVLLDEIEKAHEDVLNILLQIMEDGILTDGKGRTVNFKNTVLVMTSNVGSRRILELCRSGSSKKEDPVAATIKAISGRAPPKKEAATTTTTNMGSDVSRTSDVNTLEPEDLLKKIEGNPKAGSLLVKAAQDPDVMEAVQAAMKKGSPSDLVKASQRNPKVAAVLQEVWDALELGDGSFTQPTTAKTEEKKSGLDAIRNSFQDTVDQWSDSASETFASGLIDQLAGNAENNGEKAFPPLSNIDSTVDHELYPQLIETVKEELEYAMKPELLNRIDEIVVFSPLSSENLAMIAGLNIEKIVNRAAEEHSMELTVEPSLIERVMVEGSANADTFGARPMRRAAQRYVEDSLSDAIISGFLKTNEKATLSLVTIPHLDGRDRVAVKRASDGEVMEIRVEDASGGIGSAPQSKAPLPETAPVNGGSMVSGATLRTEPVM